MAVVGLNVSVGNPMQPRCEMPSASLPMLKVARDRSLCAIPADNILLESPTDTLDETDQAILTELRRLEQMPLARWMCSDVERAQRTLRDAN